MLRSLRQIDPLNLLSTSKDELWVALRLRVRSFYKLNSLSLGIEDHKYLVEREYGAIEELIFGLLPNV
ncbi:unnamed protein product [Linum trigynum]|uniref:Uncharacterized protein n=1 Tax=Linum trigynum TaxID=586398 RepID=A0AAV2F8R0_9ROSI